MRFAAIRWTTMLVLALAGTWLVGVAAAGGFQKPAAQTHTVVISGFKFQPDVLVVNVGDTIEWKNADIVPHTATAVDKSFNSGSIKPGATWKFVAKQAGTFNYACTPHPNMHAKLIVR
jgi:plastocyanin